MLKSVREKRVGWRGRGRVGVFVCVGGGGGGGRGAVLSDKKVAFGKAAPCPSGNCFLAPLK